MYFIIFLIFYIALGQNNDGFVCCPDEALTWESRKYLIIQEIVQNNPDVICLQVNVLQHKNAINYLIIFFVGVYLIGS